ncbi:putative domain HDIG-containing protein [Natronococcus jeotgali DSM 18795]|uniref:Putative domain HDIG-containing protein n=2 Tax=Natronococcus jeotgali TaxID=413812 RepID=L9X0S5_9EURY|nr:putative domain HDIG-containing protein [Natronococcus jeotgali DSM 18795]
MLEAKLLFDADKLEAAGARGIVRLACIVGERSGKAGEKYAVIDSSSTSGIETSGVPDIALLQEWARERLDRLYTSPGRRLGESRWEFMEEFFTQFTAELGVEQ